MQILPKIEDESNKCVKSATLLEQAIHKSFRKYNTYNQKLINNNGGYDVYLQVSPTR